MSVNSFNNTSPSINFNNLPPGEEASIRHDCPFLKVSHEDTLEQEDNTISHHVLNSLSLSLSLS